MSKTGKAVSSPKLTQEELEFIIAVLRAFPHQGNAEQLAPRIQISRSVIAKLQLELP